MHLSLRKLSTIGLVAASLGLAVAAPSAATSSISVAGTAVPTSTTFTSVRAADGNTVLRGTGAHVWTGSFTGTSVLTVHFVIHSDGQLTYQGSITFTGSTPCGAGTVQFEAQGNGPFPGPVDGTATTIDQANSSVSMHADLDTVLFVTPAGAVVTYSGDVRCG